MSRPAPAAWAREVKGPGRDRVQQDQEASGRPAWKEYWRQQGGELICRSYLLHPLVKDLPPKTHTVPLDLKKLTTLHTPDAHRVGMLLIGFDTEEAPMDPDVAELADLASLNRLPWRAAAASWADRHREGCRVRCWLWQRPT